MLRKTLTAAIVGGGPSGFYTAKFLLKAGLAVDLIERLPCPYGLVRFGVAPDHQDVKYVMQDFAKIASDSRFRFFGNVHVGKDVSIGELQSLYHAVVLAYGASGERKLQLPGEDRLVYGARDFVSWYNENPHLDDKIRESISRDVRAAREVVVVGNGNVALDCARILVSPLEELRKSDISPRALDALAEARVRKVSVCGRRSHTHAAFTIKEVRELTKLQGVSVEVLPSELVLSDADQDGAH